MGEAEGTLENILASDASLLINDPARLNLLSEWNRRISDINGCLPESRLGTKLFDSVKAHAKSITIEETTKLLELAQVRLQYHTSQGRYKGEYRGCDDQLEQLPRFVQDIKTKDSSHDYVGMFLDYCRMHCPDQPVQDFSKSYDRFVQVKVFYEGVPDDCKDALALRDELRTDWKGFEDLLGQPNDERDRQYLNWLNKFKETEAACGRQDFKEIISFLNEYPRKQLPGREE